MDRLNPFKTDRPWTIEENNDLVEAKKPESESGSKLEKEIVNETEEIFEDDDVPISVIPVNKTLPKRAMKQSIPREPRYALRSRGPVASETVGRAQEKTDEIDFNEPSSSRQRNKVQDEDSLVETGNKTAS